MECLVFKLDLSPLLKFKVTLQLKWNGTSICTHVLSRLLSRLLWLAGLFLGRVSSRLQVLHSDILTKKTCPTNFMTLSAYAVPEL